MITLNWDLQNNTIGVRGKFFILTPSWMWKRQKGVEYTDEHGVQQPECLLRSLLGLWKDPSFSLGNRAKLLLLDPQQKLGEVGASLDFLFPTPVTHGAWQVKVRKKLFEKDEILNKHGNWGSVFDKIFHLRSQTFHLCLNFHLPGWTQVFPLARHSKEHE